MDNIPPIDFAEQPEQVIAWLRGLRLADAALSAHQFTQMLRQLNQQRLPAQRHYDYLELFGQPASVVLGHLRRTYFRDQRFTLAVRAGKALGLADELCMQLIHGYQWVLHSGQEVSWLFRQTHANLWRTAIHRVFFYAYLTVTHHQMVGAERYADLWRRLHELFQLALRERWEHQPICFAGVTQYGEHSLEHYYKKCILLSLVPLGQLRQDQTHEIKRLLPMLVEELRLLLASQESDPHRFQFFVALDSDRGPLRRGVDPGPGESCLLLDMRRVESRFFQWLTQAHAETADRVAIKDGVEVSLGTLKLLKSYWMISGTEFAEFNWHPREVAEWVKGLPLLNVRDASQQLYRLLGEASLREMPVAHRFELLEVLGHPLDVVLTSLQRYYSDNSFPLPERSLKVAKLASELCELVIGGYQTVLEREEGGSWFTGLGHSRALVAIHRIFFYSGRILANHQMMNCPCRNGVWRRLHRLFRTVLQKAWSRERVGFEGVASYRPCCIGNLYKRILLLALIPFPTLRPPQVKELKKALDLLADQAEISLYDRNLPWGDSSWLVHGDADTGPLGFFDPSLVGDCPNCLILDTGELVDELLRHALRAEERDDDLVKLSPDTSISAGCLTVMRAAWRHRSGRGGARKEASIPIQVAVTLGAVHYQLFEQDRPDWIAGRAARRAERKPASALDQAAKGDLRSSGEYFVEEINYQKSYDIWDSAYGRETVDDEAWNKGRRPPRYTFIEATQIDYSNSGARIQIPLDNGTRLRVGDVIGLRRDAEAPVALAVTRWIGPLQGAMVDLGVEFLAMRIQAAVLRAVNERNEIALLPCLIGEHAASLRTILIAPYLPHIRRRRLRLIYPNREISINFTGWPLEQSQSFEAYEFGLQDSFADAAPESVTAPLDMQTLSRIQEEKAGAAKTKEEKSVWDFL